MAAFFVVGNKRVNLAYSYRNAVIGRSFAAIADSDPTVSHAITKAKVVATANCNIDKSMRYTKLFRLSCIMKYAAGQAMILAINTCFENSLLIKITISNTDAPNTLRMPISLVRRCVVKYSPPIQSNRQRSKPYSRNTIGKNGGPSRT